MGLLNDIAKRLREAKPEEREGFLSQIRKEKTLYDLLRKAGLEPAVSDPQEKAIQRPLGVLSKTEKIDEVSALINIDKTLLVETGMTNPNFVRNPIFDTGDLTGWTPLDPGYLTVTNERAFLSSYTVKHLAHAGVGSFIQYLPPLKSDGVVFVLWWYSPNSDRTVALNVIYADGSGDSATQNVLMPMWTECVLVCNPSHVLSKLSIYPSNDTGTFYYGAVWGTKSTLSLREDLDFLYFSNAFGAAGDYAILAGSAGKRHKVYALNYESSADIEVKVRDGTTTKACGVRTTRGVFAQTFIHSFVGTVNTALNLRAEGVTTVKGYIQYKTEA